MNSISLKYRIAITIFVLEAVMVSLVLWMTQSVSFKELKEVHIEEEQMIMDIFARLCTDALVTSEYGEIQSYFRILEQNPNVESVILVDFMDRVVASTETGILGGKPQLLDEDEKGYWREQPLALPSGYVGTLYVRFSNRVISEAYRDALELGITVAAVSMAVIALVSLLIGHLLVRRLERLTRMACGLALGSMGVKSGISGTDEVARLSEALDSMAERIEAGMIALSESESRNRAILDSVPDLMFQVRGDGTYLDHIAPRGGEQLAHPEDFVGRKIGDVLPEEMADSQMAMIKAALRTGNTQLAEYEVSHDGELRYYETRFARSEPDSVLVIARDITERKLFEIRLKVSIMEKEMLLKEVHHRVKNNMAIVSSLLQLQSSQISDEESKRILNESRNRIYSLALVHEKLYQSKDFTRIDVGEYLRSLAENLFVSYRLNKDDITFRMEVDDIGLDIDKLIPCGLIINELLTNSIKYAFGDGKRGEIAIGFSACGPGRAALSVSDSGPGLPAGTGIGNPATLGLQLVTSLTRQLRGELKYEGEQGAKFTVVFDI